jgi:5-methyltetrahydropteroyltriglutamate--homocysteine methyltransferase
MMLSSDRILTTHVGSLPRPPDLLAMIEAREAGYGFDDAAFAARLGEAVREVVATQVACGIDSVCDGEQSKISYTFYVRHRLSGIGTFRGAEVDKPPQTGQHLDLVDHPDAAARMIQLRGGASWFASATVPCCVGPVAYRDRRPLDADLENLAAKPS